MDSRRKRHGRDDVIGPLQRYITTVDTRPPAWVEHLAEDQISITDGFGHHIEIPVLRLSYRHAACWRVRARERRSGRGLEEDHYQYKLAWLSRLRAHVTATYRPDDSLAISRDVSTAVIDVVRHALAAGVKLAPENVPMPTGLETEG